MLTNGNELPFFAGVALRPWKGANPSGALLIFKDRTEDFVIQNSNFWNLPSPALAIANSTLTISNSSFDQHLRWGPRIVFVNRAAAVTVSGCSFSNANCIGDGAELLNPFDPSLLVQLVAHRVTQAVEAVHSTNNL